MNATPFPVDLRYGTPALWEQGGGMTNTGTAQVIAHLDGTPCPPLVVRTRGQLSNDRHALLPIDLASYIITADRQREDFLIIVHRVDAIMEGIAYGEAIAVFEDGRWDIGDAASTAEWHPAVEAAVAKTRCYHCREPHYIAQ